VVKLFRAPQMLEVLQQNALEGLDRFHIKHVVPQHIELYERLLAQP